MLAKCKNVLVCVFITVGMVQSHEILCVAVVALENR